jgi:hypothetical protein
MGGVKEELTLGLLARRGYRVPPMLTKSCEGTKKIFVQDFGGEMGNRKTPP